MTTSELKIFYYPEARLRLTIPDDRSYLTVKPAWAAPLSQPNRYLALLDSKGEEIALVAEPSTLPADSMTAVREELYRRHLTATIQCIYSARQEYGAIYWDVESDRGRREFITQNLQENALWLSETHILLIDVDGSRFEIASTEKLDERSRQIVLDII